MATTRFSCTLLDAKRSTNSRAKRYRGPQGRNPRVDSPVPAHSFRPRSSRDPTDTPPGVLMLGQTPVFPRIFGHEAGGVGEGVTDLAPGDHVLPVFTGECGECAHCKSQESNMCDILRINTDRGVMIGDGQSRFSINGKPIYHFLGTSTFSEYTVIHVGCLAKINPSAPLDKVCVVSCGISTGDVWDLWSVCYIGHCF
ncbi:hypothetical protein B296_00042744 [Ensete ventricosum]|uniref:alcohol dehydrogenase n=1 Tax=Ensete ventricosum TaxID=4639 RepID=A0A426YTC6_ENSVE|nr:hypothetical protein B296_00042744 [Ensete ventricosum]